MKAKAIFGLVLVAILAGAGIFGYSIKSGKLGSKADTISKPIKITGQVTNAKTNLPISNIPIVATNGLTTIRVNTDTNGYYSGTLNINPTDIVNRLVRVQPQSNSYYINSNNRYDLFVQDISSVMSTLNQNFKLFPNSIATSSSSSTSTSTATECLYTGGKPDDYFNSVITHQGLYRSELVNGFTFCIAEDSISTYQENRDRIIEITSKVTKSALTSLPIIYFRPYDQVDYNGVFYPRNDSSSEISFAIESLTTKVFNHELGHALDWQKGYELPAGASLCITNYGKTKSHCESSSYQDFRAAFVLARDNFGSTYAIRSSSEMYAEFYTLLNTADAKGTFTPREKLAYLIENSMLTSTLYLNPFGAGSVFRTFKNIASQNALMYLYIFTTNASNLDKHFPGTIARWNSTAIQNGYYMTVGVVPVVLKDHTGKLMENAGITVGGKQKTTRVKKGSGVFSDGSGDLFDTTGTALFIDSPIGQTVTVDVPSVPNYYNGAVFGATKNNITKGANPIINLKFNLYQTGMMFTTSGAKNVIVTGQKTLNSNGKIAKPIAKNQMTRYPIIGTDNGTLNLSVWGYMYFMLGGNVAGPAVFTTTENSKLTVTPYLCQAIAWVLRPNNSYTLTCGT